MRASSHVILALNAGSFEPQARGLQVAGWFIAARRENFVSSRPAFNRTNALALVSRLQL
jgi:hypothetical protein